MPEVPTTLIGIIGVLVILLGVVVRWFMHRLDRKDDRQDYLVDKFTETVNHKQTEMTEALHKLNKGIEYLTSIWKNGK